MAEALLTPIKTETHSSFSFENPHLQPRFRCRRHESCHAFTKVWPYGGTREDARKKSRACEEPDPS
ncbi:hypothetical protein E1A91_A08G065500v1 [Gossypium mustelinum]|uniref:Uncharacterized protein n=1 Tax=Gossypium mustelinum TaxID=34275 RepID=A0A5D2Y8F1_GOSMU|nr:hypothetical protein E1A91_A08G065500v1 [Gossypium mustelinum]